VKKVDPPVPQIQKIVCINLVSQWSLEGLREAVDSRRTLTRRGRKGVGEAQKLERIPAKVCRTVSPKRRRNENRRTKFTTMLRDRYPLEGWIGEPTVCSCQRHSRGLAKYVGL